MGYNDQTRLELLELDASEDDPKEVFRKSEDWMQIEEDSIKQGGSENEIRWIWLEIVLVEK